MEWELRNDGWYLVDSSTGQTLDGPFSEEEARLFSSAAGITFDPEKEAESETTPLSQTFPTVQGADGNYYIIQGSTGAQIGGPYPNSTQATFARNNMTFPGNRPTPAPIPDVLKVQEEQAGQITPPTFEGSAGGVFYPGAGIYEGATSVSQVAQALKDGFISPQMAVNTLVTQKLDERILSPVGAVQRLIAEGALDQSSTLEGIQQMGQPAQQQGQAPQFVGGLDMTAPAVEAQGWWTAPVTQSYGPTDTTLDSGYKGYPHFNKGIDFGVSEGTPIQTHITGEVINAGDAGDGWGISVKVRDLQGNVHNFGHLSAANVQVGQQVTPGTLLGTSGNTGKSTGPHLSYDVMAPNGEWIDPSAFVDSAKASAASGLITPPAEQTQTYRSRTYSEAVEKWRPLVEKYFPPELVDKALYVINGESGGNPTIPGDGGAAIGLFQIHHGGSIAGRPSAEQLADPEFNIAYAANQLGAASGNWGDWGEGTLYQGKPFGALGRAPYTPPGEEALEFEYAGAGEVVGPGGLIPTQQQPERLRARDAFIQELDRQFQAGAIDEFEYDRRLAAFDQQQAQQAQGNQQAALENLKAGRESQGYGAFILTDDNGNPIGLKVEDYATGNTWVDAVDQYGIVTSSTPQFSGAVQARGLEQTAAFTPEGRQTALGTVSPEQAAQYALMGFGDTQQELREVFGRTPTLGQVTAYTGSSLGGRNILNDPDALRQQGGAGTSSTAAIAQRYEDFLRGQGMDPAYADYRGDVLAAQNMLAREAYSSLLPSTPGLSQEATQALISSGLSQAEPGGAIRVNTGIDPQTGETTYRELSQSEAAQRAQREMYPADPAEMQAIGANQGYRVVANPTPPPPFAIMGPDGRIIRTFDTQLEAQRWVGILGQQNAVRNIEAAEARQNDPFGAGNTGRSIDTGVNRQAVQVPDFAPMSGGVSQPRRDIDIGGMRRPPWMGGPPEEPDLPPVVQPPYVPPEPRPPGIIYQNIGGVNMAGVGNVAAMNGMNGFTTPEEVFTVGARTGRIYSVAGEGPDGIGGMTVPEMQVTVPQSNPLDSMQPWWLQPGALSAAAYPVNYRLAYV